MRAVGREGRLDIVDVGKDLLDIDDMRADADPAAQFLLQPRRSAQVVGMGVGLQDALNRQVFVLDEAQEFFRGVRRRVAGLVVEIEH